MPAEHDAKIPRVVLLYERPTGERGQPQALHVVSGTDEGRVRPSSTQEAAARLLQGLRLIRGCRGTGGSNCAEISRFVRPARRTRTHSVHSASARNGATEVAARIRGAANEDQGYKRPERQAHRGPGEPPIPI